MLCFSHCLGRRDRRTPVDDPERDLCKLTAEFAPARLVLRGPGLHGEQSIQCELRSGDIRCRVDRDPEGFQHLGRFQAEPVVRAIDAHVLGRVHLRRRESARVVVGAMGNALPELRLGRHSNRVQRIDLNVRNRAKGVRPDPKHDAVGCDADGAGGQLERLAKTRAGLERVGRERHTDTARLVEVAHVIV